MNSVNTLGAVSCAPRLALYPATTLTASFCNKTTASTSAYLEPVAFNTSPNTLTKPITQQSTVEPAAVSKPALEQWPWRGFAFCSDLGTIGALVKQPKLAGLGWLLATPYYLLSIFSQPKGQQRKEELMYQVTANGVFPFVEAKLGTVAGEMIFNKVKPLVSPSFNLLNMKIPLNASVAKALGGLASLLLLTPALGDPLSASITKTFK